MSRLRNDRIWKAGAFDHLRAPLRQVSGPETANWKGIADRAKAVLVDGRKLIIIVEPAGSIDKAPTEHDVLNAQITTIVFRKQRHYRRYKRVVTYLQYDRHIRREILVDPEHLEKELNSCFFGRSGRRKLCLPIPSPLAGFLMQQTK